MLYIIDSSPSSASSLWEGSFSVETKPELCGNQWYIWCYMAQYVSGSRIRGLQSVPIHFQLNVVQERFVDQSCLGMAEESVSLTLQCPQKAVQFTCRIVEFLISSLTWLFTLRFLIYMKMSVIIQLRMPFIISALNCSLTDLKRNWQLYFAQREA